MWSFILQKLEIKDNIIYKLYPLLLCHGTSTIIEKSGTELNKEND